MSRLILLSIAQMNRLSPHFPRPRGLARVDDRRVVSGIVYVIRNGLQWKDAPAGYGPHKTLYNRFIRWSRLGVFDRIFAALAAEAGVPERLMIDSTHLKGVWCIDRFGVGWGKMMAGPFPIVVRGGCRAVQSQCRASPSHSQAAASCHELGCL